MTQRQHLTLLGALSFLIMLGYALARPAVESLFIGAYTSARLPHLWLLVAVVMTGVVIAVNGRLSRRRPAAFLAEAAAASGALLAGLLLLDAHWRGALFALAIWKEIYIVVLVEALYAHTNARFPISQARWLYGAMGVIGSLGGLLGNLLVGQLSTTIGSGPLLWLLAPLLALIAGLAARLPADADAPPPRPTQGALRAALAGVRRSDYLTLLMILIAVVQIAINLVDFLFKSMAEARWTDPDLRTQAIGYVYAAISIGTLLFNALTGPIFKRWGIPKVLLSVPAILGVGLLGLIWAPGVWAAVIIKVSSKVFDYTLFRTGKELLYIPLDARERLDGKPVEMWTYRTSKGLASLLLLGLSTAALGHAAVLLLLGAITALWLGLTVILARRFRRRVSAEAEARAPA
ncbi:NTP/NDP exchange transporter [Myxococcota bacterium]|nr:NTP/NDP exchange transporter [Myxococcota bacterium]